MRRVRGFTLIELLVVIAVIALLMAILIPVLSAAKKQATMARYLANHRNLLAGWIMYADDNDGMDQAFRREIARVFPDRPLVEVPVDHPVYHLVYEFPDGLPKIHEHDGKPPQAFGIFHDGRLVVFYAFQSDLGDGWEDPDVHRDPAPIREEALQMGVNLFVYATVAVP